MLAAVAVGRAIAAKSSAVDAGMAAVDEEASQEASEASGEDIVERAASDCELEEEEAEEEGPEEEDPADEGIDEAELDGQIGRCGSCLAQRSPDLSRRLMCTWYFVCFSGA